MKDTDLTEDVLVKIKRLPSGAGLPLPEYRTGGSAGMDLCAAVQADVALGPFERALIPTGISIELPQGTEAQIRPRSGLALQHGIALLNSPGTVDSDYRGEICLVLVNLGQKIFVITRGQRIGQLVFGRVCRARILEVEELAATDRGQGGFGHTGL